MNCQAFLQNLISALLPLCLTPTPSINVYKFFIFPPSFGYHLSLLPVWIPSPLTLPMTGPSVWTPLNCCCRLELCHSGSCCIVFWNDAYGTWTGNRSVRRVELQHIWAAVCFIQEIRPCMILTNHQWAKYSLQLCCLFPCFHGGFDMWQFLKLCECVPVYMHVRLKHDGLEVITHFMYIY